MKRKEKNISITNCFLSISQNLLLVQHPETSVYVNARGKHISFRAEESQPIRKTETQTATSNTTKFLCEHVRKCPTAMLRSELLQTVWQIGAIIFWNLFCFLALLSWSDINQQTLELLPISRRFFFFFFKAKTRNTPDVFTLSLLGGGGIRKLQC